MRYAYYSRLTARQQLAYRKSDAIDVVRVPPGPPLAPMVARIAETLASDDVARTRDASQALTDALTARFGLSPIAVAVLSTRPLLRDGDLYGLYEPAGKRRPIRISLWMRTARRNQVVAFRTFLRTLLHEFCHHLDYELYRLPETFHTEGFYKRESSLMRQLLPPASEDRDW